RGSGVVTSTGISSEIGKIAKLLTTIDDEPSPLQKRLGILGRWIGVLTIAVAILVFFLEYFGGTPFDEVLLGSIALAVAAIPEGLPAVVTISLALGVRRMVRRHALIRRLPAVQTLGGTTVICSDKTGTLTMDQMTVTSVFVDGKVILVSGEGYSLKGKFSDSTKDLSFLLRIGALCNDAQIGEKGVFGDPTEGALLVSAKKGGLDLKDLSFSYPRVDEIPFSSERKMMSTFHKAGSHYELYVKGAPDVLLAKCTHILFNGRVVSLNSSYREEILLANESFAKEALRVLGFAYTPSRNTSFAEERLIFVGLQGMIDPPRPEVKKAIQVCSDAGIRVVMITGDHPLTAVAIARQLGISGSVLLGVELDSIGDLSKIVGEVGVYARVNPVHKQKIVHALKQMGHIVAMTGDGVNDAPSLKDADIGIAMGITGTDVARESADMVLTDDNFASIVDAVEEGRGIYDNIKKFVNYLLSSNLGEVFVLLFAALLSFPLPLVATQILWINLVTDGLPATALSVDPPARGIMRRSPRLPKSNILSRNMGLNIFSIGFLVAVGVLFLFSVYSSDISHARTVAFTSLVVFEMVRLHMVRRQYGVGMFSNFWLLGSILLTIILQFIVVYTPFGRFFEAVALSFLDWVLIFAVALALFVFGTLSNTIIRRLTKETD
ncbi:cation-translocating P-type ATPase, partial [Candidatus Woesearchaeota archaeon]|nr:cation-translocating P-type ATPase [Candidatus Woesearchaeota archaeon]